MNHPRNIKVLAPSARVAFHHARTSTLQGKVTAGYNQHFQQLITPEGHNQTHEYLFVEPEFAMTGGSPDCTIQVSIGGENCPSEEVFGALFHESKPNLMKHKSELLPYIAQVSLVQAAGEQVVKRLDDETNWDMIMRRQWNGVYGSSGIGEWFSLFRRKLEDGSVYQIYRNQGDAALRERLLPPDRKYLKSFWTRIGVDNFFETAYSSAGEEIMDQTLDHEVAFMDYENYINN